MVRRAFGTPIRKSRLVKPGAPAAGGKTTGKHNVAPASKLSGVLKVVQKGPEDDAAAKGRTIATLMMADVESLTLGDIRKTLNLSDQDEISFCYEDYSPAPDALLLSDYLAHENESIDFQSSAEKGSKTSIVPCFLFVAPAPEAFPPPPPKPVTAASTVSDSKSFAMMAYEIMEGGDPTSRGALQSSSLGTSEPSKLTLAGLRKLLTSATRMSSKHKFCTASGMPAVDETMTFASYLRLEATETDQSAELPSVQVYYKLTKPRTERKPFKELDEMGGKVDKSDHSVADVLQGLDEGKKADKFDPQKERKSQVDLDPITKGSSTNPYAVDAGYLTEGEWSEVMRNCGIMYGWIVDTENNRVIRAPKPAFRLRMKVSPEFQLPSLVEDEQSEAKQPSVVQPPSVSPLESAKLRAQELRKKVGNWADVGRLPSSGVLGAKSKAAGTILAEDRLRSRAPIGVLQPPKVQSAALEAEKSATTTPGVDERPSSSTVGDSSTLSDATSTKNGDGQGSSDKTGSSTEPGKASTDIIEKGSQGKQPTQMTPQVPIIQIINNNNGEPEKKNPDPVSVDESLDAQQDSTSWTHTEFMRRSVQEVACVLPSFQVNDDSRVEVTVSSHEFETSMARNDFSSSSTEGSMSGGYGGFAASVSAGRDTQKSTSEKTTDSTYEKTMIAKYMIPRADIHLHPDDLEPTPELQEAIERIRVNKNVADLRKLYQDFGQLWCQRVTIGGRLQSAKTMSDTTKASEHQQKEAFKWSVGTQVTTPWVSASVKHSQGGGSSDDKNVTDVMKKEKNVFEAVGGDTILVTNPELWATSVADFRTWRVIDRGSVSSLVDSLSSIKGYASVRSWFMQALPTLSKYIELPPSREITVRLKLNSPTTQLSLSYLKQQPSGGKQQQQQMDPVYYLGHTDDCVVKPVENSVNLQVNFWSQMDMEDSKPLFSPQEFRAPVLLGFQDSQQLSDADFTKTLWSISAPFNEALQHQALVVIQTIPARTATILPTPGPNTPTPAPANTISSKPLSLGVFRNQQGVFLPCLTDSSSAGQQFWRILKTDVPPGPSTEEKTQPFIKQGDEITLAWYLSDQTAGFRDFEDDAFGRRRFATDADGGVAGNAKLFLKLPWPRFEGLQPAKVKTLGKADELRKPKSNSMVMSGEVPFSVSPNSAPGTTSTSVVGKGDAASKAVPKLTTIRTLPGITRAREHETRTGMKISEETIFAVQDVAFRVDVVGGLGGAGSSRRGDLEDELIPGKEEKKNKDDKETEPLMIALLGGLFFLRAIC